MLLINARRGPSQVHGDGLIAQEFIPAGTRIWRLNPAFDVILSQSELDRLSTPARQQLLHYCYFDPRGQTYVLSSDDDRFTNHSDDPNTIDEDEGRSSVAIRDILPGEEITWNYRGWGNMHCGIARTGETKIEPSYSEAGL